MKELIEKSLRLAEDKLQRFINDPHTYDSIEKAVNIFVETLTGRGKIICCGNGGSLCDASHFAEELTGRFRKNRRPLPAIAINDPAYLTCTANDFCFEDVYSRYVEALGKNGDALLAISTSGNSENILRATSAAHSVGMKVVSLTSKGGNLLAPLSDVAICAPQAAYSDRIQEIHIKVIHIMIEAIEAELGFE